MPREAQALVTFNRGRVSRHALARTDIKRVGSSAELQTNWMPRVLGSMMLRPGTGHIDSTLGNNFAVHLDFIKALDDTAIIEMTNQSIRVRVDEEIITRPAVSTTVRGGDFAAESPATAFTKLTDPATLPGAATIPCIAFSPDGQFMSLGTGDGDGYLLYYISGTTFTAVTGTTPPLVGGAEGTAFSPDSELVAFAHATTPFVRIMYRDAAPHSAATNWTALSNPADLPAGNANSVAFSSDGQLMAVGHATSPFVTIYQVSGTGSGTTLTKLANPSSLPAAEVFGVAFSHDGRYLACAHGTSPFCTVYEINGTTLTKLAGGDTSQFADAAGLPAGQGNGVAFSRDGVHMAVAHTTTPFVSIYTVGTTEFTKLANPGTLPDGNGQSVAFSSDNQFMAVAHTTTGFVTIYRYVSGVWTKQTDPATLPDGNGTGIAFSLNNRFLGVSHATTQFITLYEAYQWLDMDGAGASSTYTSGSFVSAFERTLSTTSGVALNGHTVRIVINQDGAGPITREGSRIKLTFQAAAVGTFTIDKCYIGYQGTGDVYDFSGTPTQITFSGGSAGFSIATGGTIDSDEITFFVGPGTELVISLHLVGTADDAACKGNDESPQSVHYKAGDDAATVNAASYTSMSRDLFGIQKIEVFESTGGSGLELVGTLYTEAKRIQAVSILNADKDVEHGIRVIVTQGRTHFHIGTELGGEDLIAETYLEAGTYSFAFTPTTNLFFIELHSNTKYSTIISSVQIEGAGDMTIPTPYVEADLRLIRWEQSGDVMYLASDGADGTYPQYKIERRATRSWGLALYQPQDGPFLVENTAQITLAPSALSGDITVVASRDLFRDGHVGALFRITSIGQTVIGVFTGANQFSATNIRVVGVSTSRHFTVTRAGTWTATVTLQRSMSEPGSWTDVATFTGNGSTTITDELDNQVAYYRVGIKTGEYTSGTATVTLAYASGGIDGICRITAVTDEQNASAIVLQEMGGTTASEVWAEGAWSEYQGFPTCVALYESRLWWAGQDRIYGSVSSLYESYDAEVEGDSGTISRSIGEGPVDSFNWILPLQRLILGAQMAEFTAKSSSFDEPLAPDAFSLKPPTTYGSAAIPAVKVDGSGIFVDRTASRLVQNGFNIDTNDYSASDLTQLIPEMFQTTPELADQEVVRIAVQRRPDTRVHCVRADGTAGVLVFDREEEVICWVDFETDGDVEDVVILPDPATQEDAVYYAIKRTINSLTVRYFERWAQETECTGGTLNKQLDSFILYSGVSTATITGLDHLEGETVHAWGAGINLGSYTVSGGSITLSQAVTSAVIGLTYRARYKSAKLAYAAAGGTALTAKGRACQVGLILADTHHDGLKVGDNFDEMVNLPGKYRGETVAADTVFEEWDDEAFGIRSGWTTDSRLCLEANAPKPCTVLAAVVTMEKSA